MVKRLGATSGEVDAVFAALADPSRRLLLKRLAERDHRSMQDLAEPLLDRMSLPAVSKHLKVLEDAGLILREREGRIRRCVLRADAMRHAADWLDAYRRFWTHQLDALESFLDAAPEGDRPDDQPSA